jgi:hypothetical protein
MRLTSLIDWFNSAVFCLAVNASAETSGKPIVDLGYSQYQGAYNSTTNVTSYLSMRFAASPTGIPFVSSDRPT